MFRCSYLPKTKKKTMKLHFTKPILYSLGALSVAGMIYTIFTAFAHEDEAISETTISISASAEDRLPQQIRTIRLHDNFHFAGEVIPLANEAVRERLESERTGNA